MPAEFWREVVDRVAAEVPGTLLLAEAFWLLEGYFVRTLGMHRVYNSAFMHMLRDEDNAGYRKVIQETLEFDPEILKRYVNFMTNPDEETAIEQFGKGDKYFGVATLLATLPGLPMIGHGQVEGFGEKYGMEFRRATLDERPNSGSSRARARDLPAPPPAGRFAEAADFLLYDFVRRRRRRRDGVRLLERAGRERSLVVYHNRFGSTTGWIRDVVAVRREAADGSKRRVRRSLAEGLGLPDDAGAFVAFRDARTGLETCGRRRALGARPVGLARRLRDHVFWEFREVCRRRRRPWARLAGGLAGAWVPSLDDALRELQLEPVHGRCGDLRRRPDGRGPRWRGDDGAAGRARAAGRGVPAGDRRGDRRRRRRGRDRGRIRGERERAFVGMAVSAEDADSRRPPRHEAAGTRIDRADDDRDAETRHGLGRRDRARCSPG